MLLAEGAEGAPRLRLLVVDEYRLLAWMVEQLSPPGTQIRGTASFEEARRIVLENPPDAAVVSLTPARLPWREFQQLCASRERPVPVLYQSCVFPSGEEAGLGMAGGVALFLRKPATRAELEAALLCLLEAAEKAGTPAAL